MCDVYVAYIVLNKNTYPSNLLILIFACFDVIHASFNMGSADPVEAVTVQPTSDTKQRKVSIQSDPVSESRLSYDNYGYEHPRRKISQVKRCCYTAVSCSYWLNVPRCWCVNHVLSLIRIQTMLKWDQHARRVYSSTVYKRNIPHQQHRMVNPWKAINRITVNRRFSI